MQGQSRACKNRPWEALPAYTGNSDMTPIRFLRAAPRGTAASLSQLGVDAYDTRRIANLWFAASVSTTNGLAGPSCRPTMRSERVMTCSQAVRPTSGYLANGPLTACAVRIDPGHSPHS